MRTVLAVAFATVATFLLLVAVFMHELPSRLRDFMRFEEGDETEGAATSWARWSFVVIAIALVLLPRLWGRVVWPEVAAAFLVSAAIGIAWAAHHLVNNPKEPVKAPRALFTLGDPVEVRATADVGAADEAVLLVIEPEKQAEDRPLSYTSTRYKAKLARAVEAGTVDELTVAVARGKEDGNATAFSADLAGAVRVYVMPAG